MENDKLEGTNLVPTTELTTAIPRQTADLIEKSFAENTIRTYALPLKVPLIRGI